MFRSCSIKTISSKRDLTYVISLILFCILTLFVPANVFAQSKEYALKAAFVVNFLRFSNFPENKSNNLNICVLGNQQVQEGFSSIEEIIIDDKTISVKFVTPTTININLCNVIYFADPIDGLAGAILKSAHLKPILTIGEAPKFIDSNGGIRLLKLDNKIRFEINVKAIRDSGIELSSKLIRLGIRILN